MKQTTKYLLEQLIELLILAYEFKKVIEEKNKLMREKASENLQIEEKKGEH